MFFPILSLQSLQCLQCFSFSLLVLVSEGGSSGHLPCYLLPDLLGDGPRLAGGVHISRTKQLLGFLNTNIVSLFETFRYYVDKIWMYSVDMYTL